ncbi:hypothetical protein K435DRAFT_881170 [Dendrothele bispora CBS 962.96]|uniref:Uncharacterized protein n=1 Tax=Dendrothele bispora (strain CBS 962.96) TaxID=1314807 RepID=A0A4S8KIL1_DENBC|nr:hypothetical protein K435DRAFT_881170 [Dendrothele bispora CBS 962.96]
MWVCTAFLGTTLSPFYQSWIIIFVLLDVGTSWNTWLAMGTVDSSQLSFLFCTVSTKS